VDNVTTLFATSPERSRLLQEFRSADPAEREQAISKAARYLEPQALGPLLAESAEANVRNAALEALVRQGPYARDYLRQLAEGEDAEIAMFCVQALSRLPDPNSAPILVMLLAHEDTNVALASIEALGLLRSNEAVPALLGILRDDEDLWRRCAAVRSLGQIGNVQALPAVLDLTHDSMMREQAIESLGGFCRPDAVGALLEMLTEATTQSGRDLALKALGKALDRLVDADDESATEIVDSWEPGAALVEYLDKTLGMPDADLARAAGHTVLLRGLEPLFAKVVRRASNDEELTWIRDLFRLRADLARPALHELLRHDDPRVRAGTAEVALLEHAFAPALMSLMDDPDEQVRFAAFRAIGRSALTAAIPALLERLGASDEREREASAEALAGMPVDELDGLACLLEPSGSKPAVLAALRVAREVPSKRWCEPALAGCRVSDPDVRLAAVKAVGAMDCANLHHELLALLDDPLDAVRAEVVEYLIRHDGPETVEALMKLLDRDDLTRYHAIRGLGRLRAGEASERLRDLYPIAATHEQLGIISALIRVRPPWIVEFLERGYSEADGDVRRAAAEGLARVATADEFARLLDMADDEDWSIRAFSVQALGRHGGTVARGALLNLARDVDPLVARSAREVLDDDD